MANQSAVSRVLAGGRAAAVQQVVGTRTRERKAKFEQYGSLFSRAEIADRVDALVNCRGIHSIGVDRYSDIERERAKVLYRHAG